jgi:hypothetical protein
MKTLNYLLFFLAVAFASCETEYPIEKPNVRNWPENTGEYAPYTIGSTFKYQYTSLGPSIKTDTLTLTVTRDTIIGGTKFYKLQSDREDLVKSYYTSFKNNSITEITYDLNFLGLITVPYLEENTFRENAPLNSTWNDESLRLDWSGVPVNVDFVHTMKNANYTKQVLANSYTSSYTVDEDVNITLPQGIPFPPGVPSTITFKNTYAKGFGLIQRDVSIGNSQKLISSNIIYP